MSHSNRALYYPFIHFKDERWLKLSALYWDAMGRITPEGYAREDHDVVRALGNYVHNLFPGLVGPAFGELFTKFISSNADKLRGRYAVANRDSWPAVPPDQLPPRAGGASGTDRRLSYVFSEKIPEDLRAEMKNSGLIQPDYSDERWIGMHPRLATVYMTALADQLAGEQGYSALTDETAKHVAIGGNTMERLAQALLGDEIDLTGNSASEMEVEDLAAYVAIETVAPKNIDEVSVDQILTFRERYPNERATFQRTLLNFVKPREWLQKIKNPDALEEQVKSEFEKEIRPKLDELREKQNSVGIATVTGVLALQVAVPSVVTHGAALAGVTADPLLAAGAGAALALSSVLRDRRKARREIASSEVSYLLRIEKDLTPRGVIGRIRDAVRRLR